jgi:hypothetical protein
MYLALAGLSGLPFSQNAMDLAQFIWRRFFGKPENLANELSDFVKQQGMDENLVMHGLLHNAAGFDLSGSFGMGRMLPGVELLNSNFKSTNELIGKGVTTFAGPAGGFWSDMVKALGRFGQGDIVEGMKELPGVLGSIGKVTDAMIRQNLAPGEGRGMMTQGGVRLTKDLTTGEYRDLTGKELFGMMMGATPTVISQNRENQYAISGEVLYWQGRRQDLLDKYWRAVRDGDAEERADVREVIDAYNETVPDRGLRVTGKDITLMTRARKKGVREMERYGTAAKRYRSLAD